MRIRVRYADWHVDDGDEAIIVGKPWRVTIELQRPWTEPSSSNDWWPSVEPVEGTQPTGLQELSGEPAGYRYIAEAVQTAEEPWAILEASGVRFAVPGHYEGRVQGTGIFVHDTYAIETEPVRKALTQQVTVVSIQHLPHQYQRQAGVWAWMTEPVFVGFGEPREVHSHLHRPGWPQSSCSCCRRRLAACTWASHPSDFQRCKEFCSQSSRLGK